MKSVFKKVLSSLALCSIALMPISQAFAAEANGDQYVNINKLSYQNEEVESRLNTGYEMDLSDFGPNVEAYDREKYGDVEFSVYKLDEEQMPGEEAMTPQQIADEVEANTSSYGAQLIETKAVDENGQARVLEGATGNYGIYVIVESKKPTTVSLAAKPMLISLPLTNTEGTGYLDIVNLYPKNRITPVTFTFEKYARYNNTEEEVLLDGANFNLFRNDEQVNEEPLVTADGGKITLNDLKVGSYRFEEIETGNERLLLNPRTAAGEANRLTFIYNADGTITYPEGSLLAEDSRVINYEATTIEKRIVDENVDFSDLVEYEVDVVAPYDIKDYVLFNVTDSPDEKLTINTDSVSIEGLVKDTDYTVEKNNNGARVIFTPANLEGGMTYTIKYNATIDNTAAALTNLVNNVVLNYNNGIETGEEEDDTFFKVYNLAFNKVDGGLFNTGVVRANIGGAEFILTNAEGKFAVADEVEGEEGFYSLNSWADTREEATTFVSNEAEGLVNIKGLKIGEYTFEETKAPAGYRLPLEPTTTFNVAGEDDETHEIVNEKAPEMPMTGLEKTVIAAGGLILLTVTAVVVSKSKKEQAK